MSLLFLLTLAMASGSPAPPRNAYPTWLQDTAQEIGARDDAVSRVMALVLRDLACRARHARCVSADDWQALEKRVEPGAPPGLLALLARLAADRNENDGAYWERVAAADPRNAYPLLLIAGEQWAAGDHALALDTLRRATQREGADDYFSATVGYIKAAVEAHPPTAAQLYPCGAAALPDHANRTEIDNEMIFHLAAEIALPRHMANLNALCDQKEAVWNEARAGLCRAAGEQLRDAGSSLSDLLGTMLQRQATRDKATQSRLTAEHRTRAEALDMALWWKQYGGTTHIRQAAAALWMDELAAHGEMAAGAALLQRFGPVRETPTRRAALKKAFDTAVQACDETNG